MLAMLRRTSSLLVALACGSFAAGQTPSIEVSAPSVVLELEDGYAVAVTGGGFFDQTPAIRVLDGDEDITSQLSVILDSESRLDSNGDGILESYDGEFSIAFGLYYDPEPGQILRVEATAGAFPSDVASESATEVDSHVQVFADDVEYGETNVHVSIRTRDLFVDALTFQVFLGTVDVTSQLAIIGPVTTYDRVEGTPPLVRYRVQYYEVDVSPLGEFQDRMHFVATASGSGSGGTAGTTSARNSKVAEQKQEPEEEDPCKDALDDFMDSLQLSGGGSSGAPVSVGASADAVAAAAETLQEALEENDCPMSGEHTGPNGQTMEYDVGDDGGSSAGRNAAASGAADLVVAIGGDGNPGASGGGGNATATNDQPGGAAIAVGGDGGGGQTSKPGDGGDATVTVTPASPSTLPGVGQATAIGGNGATPANPAHTGGDGGNATATADPFTSAGTGQPGAPGLAGAGAWVSIVGSQGWLGY